MSPNVAVGKPAKAYRGINYLRLGSGGSGRLLPGPLRSLDDEALLDGLDGDADVTDFTAGQQRLNALEVRKEPAFRDGGDVHTDTAFFLGLTGTPDVVASGGAPTREFANT